MTENVNDEILAAIQDLTRVVLATQGGFATKADAVRRLTELSIPPARIANLLSISTNTVHSTLTKAKRRGQRANDDGVQVQSGTDSEGTDNV